MASSCDLAPPRRAPALTSPRAAQPASAVDHKVSLAPARRSGAATRSAQTVPAATRAAPGAKLAFEEVEVLGLRPLSGQGLMLRVARPRGFDFPATQVVSLAVGGEKRTLTIASGPSRPYLEFATLHGRSAFKAALANLTPGDTVGLRGPYGRFALDASQPALMLAGHIGVGPFKAMLEHAVDDGLPLEGVLLHARPEGEASLTDEVAALVDALPGMRLATTSPGGLADPERLASFLAPDAQVYVAGAPGEVFGAAGALEALGVSGPRVKVELFAGYR